MSQQYEQVISDVEAKHSRILWHDPKRDMLFFGTEFMPYGPEPTYAIPVYNMKVARQAKKMLTAGAKRDDLPDAWMPEFRKKAQLYETLRTAAQKAGRMRVAATGTNADFSDINVVNVMTKVLGLEFPNRVLIESIMSQDVPDTLLSIDVGTPYEGVAQAGENFNAEPERQSYVRTTVTLPKDMALFSLTDEAQMRASHNLFQLHVDNAPLVLRKIENKTIATLIETATNVSAGDWGAITSGLSDRDPWQDIAGVLNTLSGNGGDLSNYSIAWHNTVDADFGGNTFVRGAYNRRTENIAGTGRVYSIDRLPGATIYVDNDKTATIASIYTRDAFIRANGPTMVAQWRDEWRMTEQYRAAHFCKSGLYQTGRARDLTGVTA